MFVRTRQADCQEVFRKPSAAVKRKNILIASAQNDFTEDRLTVVQFLNNVARIENPDHYTDSETDSNDEDDDHNGEATEIIDVVEPEVTDVDDEGTDVVEAEVTDVVEAEVTDVVEAEVTDVAEAEVTDVAEAEVSDVAEAEVTDVVEAEVTDFAEAEIIDVAEAEIIDVAEAEITDVAEVEITDVIEAEIANVAARLPLITELNRIIPSEENTQNIGQDKKRKFFFRSKEYKAKRNRIRRQKLCLLRNDRLQERNQPNISVGETAGVSGESTYSRFSMRRQQRNPLFQPPEIIPIEISDSDDAPIDYEPPVDFASIESSESEGEPLIDFMTYYLQISNLSQEDDDEAVALSLEFIGYDVGPMDEEMMSSKITHLRATHKMVLDKESCCWCKNEYATVGEELTQILGCTHIAHSECLVGWLRRSAVCPLCKYKL